MTDNKPVYEFIPITEYEKPTKTSNVGIFLIVVPALLYITFILIIRWAEICVINDKATPCGEIILPFSLLCLGPAGFGLMIILGTRFYKGPDALKSKEIYRCYEDRIELYGITVKRENMIDISFSYNIGEKKKKIGSIEIGTNTPIYLDDDSPGDDFILLEDVPNAQDAYFKIKYLYNLPDKKK